MPPETTKTMGVWTASGIAVGIVIGSGLDNIGAGIAIGAGVGAALGTFMIQREKHKGQAQDEARH